MSDSIQFIPVAAKLDSTSAMSQTPNLQTQLSQQYVVQHADRWTSSNAKQSAEQPTTTSWHFNGSSGKLSEVSYFTSWQCVPHEKTLARTGFSHRWFKGWCFISYLITEPHINEDRFCPNERVGWEEDGLGMGWNVHSDCCGWQYKTLGWHQMGDLLSSLHKQAMKIFLLPSRGSILALHAAFTGYEPWQCKLANLWSG